MGAPEMPPDTFRQIEGQMDETEKIITAPFTYLDKIPGKDLRSLMIEAFNKVLSVPPDALVRISRIIRTLHTASLLVDDVEDSATLRRGQPVAHAVYGVPQTINSSNYMMFVALEDAIALGPSAVSIFTEEIKNLHAGQGLDLYWRDTFQCPTLSEYIDMVLKKTGGLYRMAVRLMQSQSSSSLNLVALASDLGILYQVQDDYLNLQSGNYTVNKGFCEDLTEGKFSLPIIHAIRSDRSNTELLSILRQRTQDETLKRHALKYMESQKSFEYTIELMHEYEAKARRHVEAMSDSNAHYLLELIDRLVLV